MLYINICYYLCYYIDVTILSDLLLGGYFSAHANNWSWKLLRKCWPNNEEKLRSIHSSGCIFDMKFNSALVSCLFDN